MVQKIVLNNGVGCETLNQVRPYTRPCQLRAKKPNWHLLLNRDLFASPLRTMHSAILNFWTWKNPFDSECLAFVLAHRKASGTRLIWNWALLMVKVFHKHILFLNRTENFYIQCYQIHTAIFSGNIRKYTKITQ